MSDLDPKVKVIRGQKIKIIFLRINPFKIVVGSRDKKKLKCSLFSSLNISEYDYGRSIASLNDQVRGRSGQGATRREEVKVKI